MRVLVHKVLGHSVKMWNNQIWWQKRRRNALRFNVTGADAIDTDSLGAKLTGHTLGHLEDGTFATVVSRPLQSLADSVSK